jgi:hypothetical protein
MNKMQKKISINPSLASATRSYCKRNNINEKQFLRAMNWYQSAMRNPKKASLPKSFVKSF